jgi:membrane protein required for colicin V production
MGFSEMSQIDIVVVVLIAVMALKGYLNGALREFFSFSGVIGGVYAASHSASYIARMLTPYIKESLSGGVNPAVVKLIAFVSVLALVWGGISMIGRALERGEQGRLPSHLSRFGGYLLGAVKYFLIVSLIVTAIVQTPSVRKKSLGRAIVQSRLYPYFHSAGVVLMNISKADIYSAGK